MLMMRLYFIVWRWYNFLCSWKIQTWNLLSV